MKAKALLLFLLILGRAAQGEGDEKFCAELQARLASLANHDECTTSDECVAVQLPPPYGCNRPLNKAFMEELGEVVASYEHSCAQLLYSCLRPATGLECRDGRCEIAGITGGPVPSNTTVDQYGRRYK